jgi:hypothetical protein
MQFGKRVAQGASEARDPGPNRFAKGGAVTRGGLRSGLGGQKDENGDRG